MRFLFNTGIYKPAVASCGPVFSVSGLAEALVRRGHEVTVIACLNRNVYAKSIKPGAVACVNGVTVVYFKPQPYIWQRLPIQRLKDMSVSTLGRELELWLDENLRKFDVVDSQLGFLGSNSSLSRRAKKMGLVYFYHQRGNLDPTHFGANHWFKKIYISLIELPCIRRADRLIALSPREEEVFRNLAPRKPTEIIPNGVDLEEWRHPAEPSDHLVEMGLDQREVPLILWFSRYNPLKGPDFFIDLVSRLKKCGLSFKALMAGSDEDGLFRHCKERVLEEELSDVLDVLPALAGAERRYVLQRSDIFVLPTHGEGFSMAILEAMACKSAVVTTTEANFPEMVEAEAGFALCRDDIDSFTNNVETLINDRRTWGKTVENAYSFILDNYSWAKIAGKYEKLALNELGRKGIAHRKHGAVQKNGMA